MAGADAIELDVRQTADGVLVIHHSPTRRGTLVSRLSYAELQRRCRHRPPVLEESVEVCAGRAMLDVEIKEPGYEGRVLGVLEAQPSPPRPCITSFHPEVVTAVKALRPKVACGLIVGARRLGGTRRRTEVLPLELGRRCGADFIAAHQLWLALRPQSRRHPLADSPLLAAARSAGVPLVVWTVNGAVRLRRYLADPRIAGIITDLPALAVQLRGTGLRPQSLPPNHPCPYP